MLSPGIVKHFSHVWTQFSCSRWFSTFQLLGMWFVNCAEVERVSVPHQVSGVSFVISEIQFAMCPHDWLFQDKESGEWRGCPTPGLSTVSSGQCKFWILVSECWSVYSDTNFWLVQDSAANSNVFSKNQDSTLSKKPKLCSLPIRIMVHHVYCCLFQVFDCEKTIVIPCQ